MSESEQHQELPATSSNVINRPGGFWLRLVAKLADIFVIHVVGCLLFVTTALLHVAGVSGMAAFGTCMVAAAVLPLGYMGFLTCHGRQTLGYRLAGLRVESDEGKSIGLGRALVRAFINQVFLSLAGLGIGLADFIWVALDRRKRALHDILTGTQVVCVAPPKALLLGVCAVASVGFFLIVVPASVGLQAFYIPSGAMQNTLQVKDKIVVNTHYFKLKEPQFQDVIVFVSPDAAGAERSDFIKRCIGVPGDVIEVKNRVLFRNGKRVQEPYAHWSAQPPAPIYSYDLKIVGGKIYSRESISSDQAGEWLQTPGIFEPDQARIDRAKPEAVPPGQFLMLGDHRNNSNDSHAWGFVPRANLIGKAMFIYWPVSRLKNL